MKRDKYHVSQHPKFVRGRLKAIDYFIDTLPDTDDKHNPRSLLKMGYVHPEIDYEFTAKTAQFGVSQSETPLTFTELTNYSTWFYIHPEKICGKEEVTTSRDFPIRIKGNEQTVKDAISATLTSPAPKTNNRMNDELQLTIAKARAYAYKKRHGLNGLKTQNLPPLPPQTAALLKQTPYESLSGLSGLGKLNPNKTEAQKMGFDETDRLYNTGISTEEKQAWVYYRKQQGEPMTGWGKYDVGKLTQSKEKQLVQSGALYYNKGVLLPYPVYTYANTYDRILELGQDKKHIVKTYGQQAYDLHLKALTETKPKEISVRAPDSKDRPVILPISKFANDTDIFKVYGLDEGLADVELPSAAVTEGVSLQKAFKSWLYSLEDTEINGVSAWEIDTYYLQAKRYDSSLTDDEKSTIEKNAPLEGNALFARFLYEALTDEDKVKLDFTWNRLYNGQASVQYSRIPVGFLCSAFFKTAPLSITPIQREGIAFMSAVGSGIIAYDVGVGKTMTAIVNIANALYSGKCKRPLFVVPNPTYGKWLKELFGYTDKATGTQIAGVLSGAGYALNDWYNLGSTAVSSKSLTEKVKENTVTIVTYEGLMRMGFSSRLMDNLFGELADNLMQNDPEKPDKKRDIAQMVQKLEELIGGSNKNTLANVDELGFDYICVDEAHNYKNVFAYVPPDEEGKKRFKMDGATSARAQKLFFITNYIQRTYGSNVMMLTATPFTNNPLEIYSMLAMVGYKDMEKYGVKNLYDFMETFVNQSMEYVMTYQGDIAQKFVVKSFNNRLVLQRLIYNHISYKTGEEAGVKRPVKINLPRTTKTDPRTGLPVRLPVSEQLTTYLKMTQEQQTYQDRINRYPDQFTRFEKIKAIMRCLGWSLDNALSPYLYTKTFPETAKEFIEASPKIQYTVECIRSVKQWHEARGESISGQVIYMNRGKDYFKYIVDYLIEDVGFKPSVKYKNTTVSEVEIITSEVAQGRREIIKDAFLDGAVKVVIGTATIREGIDLQANGTVLYNCYPDWNPTDAKQLEGRIWRQGNRFGYVRVVMPLVQDSMDVFVFQKLEEKTQRINDIWYKADRGNVLDLDSLDTEEVKFALYSNIEELADMALDREAKEAAMAISVLQSKIKTVDNIHQNKSDLYEYREKCHQFTGEWVRQLTQFINNPSAYGYVFKKYTKQDMLPYVDKATTLLKEIQLYRDTAPVTDMELIALHRKVKANPLYFRDLLTKGYKEFSAFKSAVGGLAKAEKTVFVAKGYSIDTDFEKVKQELVDELNVAGDKYKSVHSPENKAEVAERILEQKEKLKVNGRKPIAATEDFKSLNYLLAYKFNPSESMTNTLPKPGNEPPPQPAPEGDTAEGDDETLSLAIAKAKAYLYKIKYLKSA